MNNQFPVLRGADTQQSRTQDNINSVLQPLATALQRTPIMGAPPPAWINADLTALQAWAPDTSSPGLPFPAFHKDALGYVHIKGVVANISGLIIGANITTFTLPVGYRPNEYVIVPCAQTGAVFQQLQVTPNGDVTFALPTPVGATNSIFVSFLAEH